MCDWFDAASKQVSDAQQIIAGIVGTHWLERNKKKELDQRTEDTERARKSGRHTYLLRELPHPIIQWCLAADAWLQNPQSPEIFAASTDIGNLCVFADCCVEAQSLPGFAKQVLRLKTANQFWSAFHEIDVASVHLIPGRTITFVEEKERQRTADLHITDNAGRDFFIECKCVLEDSARDRKISACWRDLHVRLLHYMASRKLNYDISIAALSDPEMSDVKRVYQLIEQRLETGAAREAIEIDDPAEQFEIVLKWLAPPDLAIAGAPTWTHSPKPYDHVWVSGQTAANGTHHWNPLIVRFRNENPSDKTQSLLNAVKSACDQLPKYAPGMVWIRLPNSDEMPEIVTGFKDRIRGELSGAQNRRVNAVALLWREARITFFPNIMRLTLRTQSS